MRIWVVLAVLAGTGSATYATPSEKTESPASPVGVSHVLGWDHFRGLLANHPMWTLARSRLDQAAGRIAVSRAWANPRVGAAVGETEAVAGPDRGTVWDMEATLSIPWLGSRRARIGAAEAGYTEAIHEARHLRRQAEVEVRTAFWRLVFGQEQLALLRRSERQLETLVDVAQRRVAAGEARPMERHQFAIELARLRIHLDEAQRSSRTGEELLRLWLGSDLPDLFEVEGKLTAEPAIPSLDRALALVATHQPETQAAAARVQMAVARLRQARAARFPEVEVGAFYEKELDSRSYGAGLEVSVPLLNWNGAAIGAARADELAARRQHGLTVAETEAAVRRQHAACIASARRALSLRERIAPLSQEVTGALEEMYQVGEVDVLDVLDARRRLMEIEGEVLEASLSAQLATLELARLTGDEVP